jgi:hypothetical protein
MVFDFNVQIVFLTFAYDLRLQNLVGGEGLEPPIRRL